MAVLFMILIWLRVTKLIIFLKKQVGKVGTGNFDIELGSSRKDEFGVLEISTTLSEHMMILTVRDHGVGMSPEQMDSIRDRLSNQLEQDDRHIGFVNISERIRLHFGEQYGICLNSSLGEGTTITITMPALPFHPQHTVELRSYSN